MIIYSWQFQFPLQTRISKKLTQQGNVLENQKVKVYTFFRRGDIKHRYRKCKFFKKDFLLALTVRKNDWSAFYSMHQTQIELVFSVEPYKCQIFNNIIYCRYKIHFTQSHSYISLFALYVLYDNLTLDGCKNNGASCLIYYINCIIWMLVKTILH